jgi:hypothetical protein
MAEETETFNVIDDSIDAQNESGDLSVDVRPVVIFNTIII